MANIWKIIATARSRETGRELAYFGYCILAENRTPRWHYTEGWYAFHTRETPDV